MKWNRKLIIPDFSRYDEDVDGGKIAEQNMPVVILRASDSYFLPERRVEDEDYAKYKYPLERHEDAYYRDNRLSLREAGVVTFPYHFFRYNRSIAQNFKDFSEATKGLDIKVMSPDLEQVGSQLIAASLSVESVGAITDDLLDAFSEKYKLLIYTASWWANKWLAKSKKAGDYPLWVASWKPINNNLPIFSAKPRIPKMWLDSPEKVLFWQYTDDGVVEGTGRNGVADHDLNLTVFNREELLEWLGEEPLSINLSPGWSKERLWNKLRYGNPRC